MNPFALLAALVERDGAASLVTVVEARGSTPRAAGARMVVSRDGDVSGTIGGGRLEFEAMAAARRSAAEGRERGEVLRYALGPALGQCCGGHVTVLLETHAAASVPELAAVAAAAERGPVRIEASLAPPGRPRRRIVGASDGAETAHLAADGTLVETVGRRTRPVFLFGAGHVGRALVLALAPLPFAVTWVDGRQGMFPSAMPRNVTPVAADDPVAVAAGAPQGAFVVVMTHDHDLDLAILHAVLAAGRAAWTGVIGSATKRARFERRLAEAGLDERTAAAFRCPIGVAGVGSKEPAVIAASVAADLLVADEACRSGAAGTAPLLRAVGRGVG